MWCWCTDQRKKIDRGRCCSVGVSPMTKGPKLQGTQSGKVLVFLDKQDLFMFQAKRLSFLTIDLEGSQWIIVRHFFVPLLSLDSNEIITQKLWTGCQCLLLLKTSKGQKGIYNVPGKSSVKHPIVWCIEEPKLNVQNRTKEQARRVVAPLMLRCPHWLLQCVQASFW